MDQGLDPTPKERLAKPRVPPDVRRRIVEMVVGDGLSGAEAARANGVSEATVHRIMRAEQEADPAIALVMRERSSLRGDSTPLPEVVPASRRRSALTEEQQLEIVRRVAAGADISTDLALEFGVHKSTISRALRGSQATSSPVVINNDPREMSRRVAEGIAKAIAAGGTRGPKPKLSAEMQNDIGEAVISKKETFGSLARAYGVSPSTISRIVRERRRDPSGQQSQSLKEMFQNIFELADRPIVGGR